VTGRDQHRRQPPGVAADHRQHRQPRRPALLPEPDRNGDRREPEIALSQLARIVGRPARRVRRQVSRPQLPHPVLQNGQPPLPPDPLRDHRRRHRRIRLQKLPDPRLERIHRRPRRPALVLRRAVARQSRPHRVPRNPQRPRDHLDRQVLRPMQPADFSPILHCEHLSPPDSHRRARRFPREGQFPTVVTGSVFTRRRQLDGRTSNLEPRTSNLEPRTSNLEPVDYEKHARAQHALDQQRCPAWMPGAHTRHWEFHGQRSTPRSTPRSPAKGHNSYPA
jgi:hypothetical protein